MAGSQSVVFSMRFPAHETVSIGNRVRVNEALEIENIYCDPGHSVATRLLLNVMVICEYEGRETTKQTTTCFLNFSFFLSIFRGGGGSLKL